MLSQTLISSLDHCPTLLRRIRCRLPNQLLYPSLNLTISMVMPNNVGSDLVLFASNTLLTRDTVLGYNDWDTASQFPFQDMHTFPNYMFNTSEVTNEYNLLNDFLSTSLLDDAYYQGDDPEGILSDPSFSNNMGSLHTPNPMFATGLQPTQLTPPSQSALGNATAQPPSGFPLDKAQERYYMTAADPAGTDNPEERMNKLLRAKYDAGMLKPFNYVNGYARLNQYMERHLQPNSRQRILRQLDQFRPGFRERMRKLTDMELVKVEMWFETCLMEYDRVFASMAIPACCWRRTGEIFRGNREMAELIKVPLEQLRDVREGRYLM